MKNETMGNKENQPQNHYDLEDALKLSLEEIIQTHPKEALEIIMERCNTNNPTEIDTLSKRYTHTMGLYNTLSQLYAEIEFNSEA